MNENEARAILYQEFRDNWNPSIPYTFDNESFDADGVPEWVRLTVRHTPGGQHTLGAPGHRRFRRRGLVIVQVFVPVDRGLLRCDELAKAARDIFEGKTLSGVMLHDGNYREVGPDRQWFQGNVTVDFSFDETK